MIANRTWRMCRANLAALVAAALLAGTAADAESGDVATVTLHVFGPELPFMFPTSRPAKDFA